MSVFRVWATCPVSVHCRVASIQVGVDYVLGRRLTWVTTGVAGLAMVDVYLSVTLKKGFLETRSFEGVVSQKH